jgi:cytochrome c553
MRILFLFLMFISPKSFAATAKELSQTCVACHGQNGISNNNLWPNLAGQKRDYIVKQLLNFKSQERKDPIMNPISSTLSEDDINQLADYYSTLK